MEPNQPGKWVCPLSPSHDQSHIIAIEADQSIERDRMFFWACAHLGILQKKRIKIQVKKVNNQRLYRPYDYIGLQKSGGRGGGGGGGGGGGCSPPSPAKTFFF